MVVCEHIVNIYLNILFLQFTVGAELKFIFDGMIFSYYFIEFKVYF